MSKHKRYFVVWSSMSGYLDRTDDIICYDVSDLRHCLAEFRDEFMDYETRKCDYEIINPVNSIIKNAFIGDVQYIVSGFWVVYVKRVHVIERETYDRKMLGDAYFDNNFDISFFETWDMLYYRHEYEHFIMPVMCINGVTAMAVKISNGEILEVWVTENNRPHDNNTWLTKVYGY